MLQLTYEIKINLIRKDSLKDNVKDVFILNLDKSLFNRIEFIEVV